MKLENVVPWGRNLEEYQTMFLLSNQDLESKILGCGDGPSSFNFEATQQNINITSIDPIVGTHPIWPPRASALGQFAHRHLASSRIGYLATLLFTCAHKSELS